MLGGGRHKAHLLGLLLGSLFGCTPRTEKRGRGERGEIGWRGEEGEGEAKFLHNSPAGFFFTGAFFFLAGAFFFLGAEAAGGEGGGALAASEAAFD